VKSIIPAAVVLSTSTSENTYSRFQILNPVAAGLPTSVCGRFLTEPQPLTANGSRFTFIRMGDAVHQRRHVSATEAVLVDITVQRNLLLKRDHGHCLRRGYSVTKCVLPSICHHRIRRRAMVHPSRNVAGRKVLISGNRGVRTVRSINVGYGFDV